MGSRASAISWLACEDNAVLVMSKNVKLVIDFNVGTQASVIFVLPKCNQVSCCIWAMVSVPASVIAVLSRFNAVSFGSSRSGFRPSSEILDSQRLTFSSD